MPPPDIGVRATVENLGGYEKAMGAIEKANDSAAKSIEGTTKTFDAFGKAFDSSTAIAVAAGNLISSVVVGAFNAVMGVIGKVIDTIGNLAKNIFDSGITFSQTMANISSVTRITGKDLDNIAKRIIEIGADSAVGPQAVADAFYDVASAVSGTEDQFAVLNAAVQAAEANQGNLAATTDTVISMFNAYGPAVSDATDALGDANYIADILSQTVAAGKGKLDEFSAAMTPIAGLAAKNNVQLDEFGAAMAYMTKQGIPAEQAATALKNAITSLSRETPGMTRALRAMGVQATAGEKSLIKSSIATNGFAKTLQLLEQGAKKTNQNLTTMVGSTETLMALGAIGTEEFQKFFDEFVDGADQATQKMRELQRADVSFQLRLIGSRFNAIGLSISQAVLPAFNKFLKFINESFKKFDWKKIGEGLDKLGEKLGESASKIIDNLGKALGEIDWNAVATGISNAFSSIGEFIANIDWEAVINGAKNFIQVMQQVATGVFQFFQNSANQAGLFIGQWQTTWLQISNAVSTAFNNVKTFIDNAITTVSGAIQGVINVVKPIWDNFWTSVSGTVNIAFMTVQAFINTHLQPVLDAISNLINALKPVWDIFWTDVGNKVNTALTDAKTFIDNALAPFKGAIDAIISAVQSVWNPFADAISSKINEALNSIHTTAIIIKIGIKLAFQAISDAIITSLGPAADFINGLAASIRGLIPGGGGGGGGVPGSAKGGVLQEGLNIVGEKGAEAILKSGSKSVVIPHSTTKSLMSSMAIKAAPGAGLAAGVAKSLSNATKSAFSGGKTNNPITSAPAIPEVPPIDARALMQKFNIQGLAATRGISDRVSFQRPQAIPISAGGGDTVNNVTNNRNVGSVIFNGVRDGESAIQRFARLTAAGRL